MSLRLKVILAVCAIQLMIITAFVYPLVEDNHRMVEEHIKRNAVGLARFCATTIEDPLTAGDAAAVSRGLERARSQEDVAYVAVQDAAGRIIAASGDIPPAGTSYGAKRSVAGEDAQVLWREVRSGSEEWVHASSQVFEAAVPVRREGETIGRLRLGVTTRRSHQQVVDSTLTAVKILGIALVTGVGLAFVVDRQMRKTIRKLINVTQRMAQGDLTQRVKISTGDELEILGESFNRMAQTVYELENRIKGHAEQLEEKIEERTRELRESQAQLIQQEKMAVLGRIAAGVAHELNTPLGTIMGLSQMLAEEPASEQGLSDLRVIEEQAQRCRQIVKELLEFSRPSMDVRGCVDLGSLIEKSVRVVEYDLSLSGITVDLRLSRNLPQCMADNDKIQQVFLNLINNARDSMSNGGTLTITTGLSAGDPACAEIDFSDTGCGIARKNLKHIFDPFFTTKATGKGTGLGLSICNKIVQEHGGTIAATSEVGKGTHMRIRLPLIPEVDRV